MTIILLRVWYTLSFYISGDTDGTSNTVIILLGSFGVIIMGIAVGVACLIYRTRKEKQGEINESGRNPRATKPKDFYRTSHYDGVDYNYKDGVNVNRRKTNNDYGEIQLN